MISRQRLLAVAVAAGSLGLALAFVPGLDPAVGMYHDAPVLLAILVLVVGLTRGRQWVRGRSAESTQAPDREPGPVVPGAELDASLSRLPAMGPPAGSRRAIAIRAQLRDVAVDALVTQRGLTEEEAESALDAGEWTDDPLAAAFFASKGVAGTSVRGAVSGLLTGQGPFRRRADRASREILRLVERRGGDA